MTGDKFSTSYEQGYDDGFHKGFDHGFRQGFQYNQKFWKDLGFWWFVVIFPFTLTCIVTLIMARTAP